MGSEVYLYKSHVQAILALTRLFMRMVYKWQYNITSERPKHSYQQYQTIGGKFKLNVVALSREVPTLPLLIHGRRSDPKHVSCA